MIIRAGPRYVPSWTGESFEKTSNDGRSEHNAGEHITWTVSWLASCFSLGGGGSLAIVMSNHRYYNPVEVIPGRSRNVIPESGETYSPSRRNRCSPSARNRVPSLRKAFRDHPGILFTFARNSQAALSRDRPVARQAELKSSGSTPRQSIVSGATSGGLPGALTGKLMPKISGKRASLGVI